MAEPKVTHYVLRECQRFAVEEHALNEAREGGARGYHMVVLTVTANPDGSTTMSVSVQRPAVGRAPEIRPGGDRG